MKIDIDNPEVLKVLKFIYRKKSILAIEVDKKFPYLDLTNILNFLWSNDFIESSRGNQFLESTISPGRFCGNIIYRYKLINQARWKDRILGFILGIATGATLTFISALLPR